LPETGSNDNMTAILQPPSAFMPASPNTPITTLLARIPLFSGLAPEELVRIAQGTREIVAAKGKTLFHRGDQPTGFHLVTQGQVKLAVSSSQGSEKVVEILSQGQLFGVAMMFLGKPYITHAQTLKDSRLLFISKSAVYDELERNPRLAHAIIKALSMRLFDLISDVEAYSLHTGRQRVIDYLLDAADTPTLPLVIDLPTSKGIVASRLNLTQEHFSRILRELVDAELIVVEGRKIIVPDIPALRNHKH
jgi:CRP-like cAMP-binding protein